MNLLKEIVFGKEGIAEREKKHQMEHAHVSPYATPSESSPFGTFPPEQNVPAECVVTQTTQVETHTEAKRVENTSHLETQMAKTSLHDEDIKSVVESVKREEIREGIQTIETTKEPESIVTVPKEAVIREHIHPVEKIEIQPVVHRDRQQMEVHQITQPIVEREVLPAVVKEAELPAQYIGEFIENDASSERRYEEGAARYESSVDVDGIKRIRIIKEPIVEETIHKTIIEEVQPVIYKETIAPVVIKETLPLYEQVREAPVIIQEERTELNMGVKLPEDKNKIPLSPDLIEKLYSHQEDTSLVKVQFEEKEKKAV
jgi:hypothetical protein